MYYVSINTYLLFQGAVQETSSLSPSGSDGFLAEDITDLNLNTSGEILKSVSLYSHYLVFLNITM